MSPLEIRNKLRELGYSAKLVNVDCYDIDQNGWIHYLSAREGQELAESSLLHPVDLHDYVTRIGLNLWYTFNVK